jgi:REP element-mobilizing transposase RayT
MPLIEEHIRESLERYIAGIISKRNQRMIAIYCMPDHTHILLGLNGETAISALVRDIKSISSKHLNKQGHRRFPFRWQEGYGAFSYGNRDLHKLIAYVREQPKHHQNLSFDEEYMEILIRRDIDFDIRYLYG